MSDAFSISVPGPAPALNSTYKVNYGDKGKRSFYKDSKVTVWQESVAWQVKAVKPRGWAPKRRVLVTIEWYSPRKRDSDAGLKACLDAVATGLGIDDSCFLYQVLVNEIDKDNPRTLVRIENVDEA